MFPVLVSLANPSNVLLPGMNGEVTMITQQRQNVIAVPNDALRSAGDMQTIAAALGLNLDSIRTATQRSRRNNAGATTGARGTGTGGGSRGTAQFVFIKQGNGWMPRRVRVGVSDYDYSEVLSGVKEGDVVALPAALLVQEQRDERTQRIRTITGNGIPGSGSSGRGRGR
jgi:HlyD family secretion protein